MKRTNPARRVKCQNCAWQATRNYGARGILALPCPECGSRVTYATPQRGDQPVTIDPKLAKAA